MKTETNECVKFLKIKQLCKLNFNLISLEKYVQITFISHPTLMPLQVKSVHTKCTDFTYTTPRNGKVN